MPGFESNMSNSSIAIILGLMSYGSGLEEMRKSKMTGVVNIMSF